MQWTNVNTHNDFVSCTSAGTQRKSCNGADLDYFSEENGNNRQLHGGLGIELVQPI